MRLAAILYVDWLERRRGEAGLIGALARPGLRADAANRLGFSKTVAAVPALICVLQQPRGPGREEAAGALGGIGDERAAPALRATLDDDDLAVQAAAHWSLGKLGRHETWWEVWEDDRQALLGWVRETLRGILEGLYDEWVREGEFRAATGVLHLADGDRTITNNHFGRRPRGADHLTYEPYL